MLRPYKRRRLAPNNMKERQFGDFEYVIFAKPPPKVAFGSGLPRETLPMGGPCISPFMRRFAAENFTNIAPGHFDVSMETALYNTIHKPTSKLGVGSRSTRWPVKRLYQAPPREPSPPKPFPQYKAAFNHCSQRKSKFGNNYPGPGTYNPLKTKKFIKFSENFGGKKYLKCVVEIKCVPYNVDTCEICGILCTKQGDYWHYENRVFMCRKHYARLLKTTLSQYAGMKLMEFKPIRDCFFMHEHNNCNVAVRIMKNNEVKKKLRTEAYFDLFIPQRKQFL